MSRQDDKDCRDCGRWVIWTSLWGSFGMGAMQMITGKLSGSVALSIDGLRSLSGGIGSIFVLAGWQIGSKPSDASHPFGHGKAQFLVSVGIYSALVAVGALFLFESTVVSLSGWTRVPNRMGGVAALLCLLANYICYGYNRCAGLQLSRPVMVSNGHGNLIGAVTSALVFAGILLARAGYPVADPLVGAAVSLSILALSGYHWWHGLSQLLDRSAPRGTVDKVREVALSVEGVLGTGRVRTRLIGANLWVDLDILVSPDCSIEAANRLAAEVRGRLLAKAKRVEDVMVYYRAGREPA